MSATTNDTTTNTNDPSTQPRSSIVDTVFDTVLTWIDAGLGHLKSTLASSARAIERTANTLDTVRERLRA
jgi:hypothetical protein